MAARKKVAPKPAEVVDAEYVETTPVAGALGGPLARTATAAKPAVEAEVVDV